MFICNVFIYQFTVCLYIDIYIYIYCRHALWHWYWRVRLLTLSTRRHVHRPGQWIHVHMRGRIYRYVVITFYSVRKIQKFCCVKKYGLCTTNFLRHWNDTSMPWNITEFNSKRILSNSVAAKKLSVKFIAH